VKITENIKTYLRWYDLWIGIYINLETRVVYVCLLPTWVIEFSKKETPCA